MTKFIDKTKKQLIPTKIDTIVIVRPDKQLEIDVFDGDIKDYARVELVASDHDYGDIFHLYIHETDPDFILAFGRKGDEKYE